MKKYTIPPINIYKVSANRLITALPGDTDIPVGAETDEFDSKGCLDCWDSDDDDNISFVH